MEDMIMLAIMESSADNPKIFKQAMKSPDSEKWVEACAAEVASLVENKVFAVVDRPRHLVITSKWVFKRKRGLSREVEKYKARLVARGFMQAKGIDYSKHTPLQSGSRASVSCLQLLHRRGCTWNSWMWFAITRN